MFEYYKFMKVDELYRSGKFDEAKALLLELQAKYINSCDENTMIRLKLRELEDLIFLSKNLIFDGINYWLINDNHKQGPFCKKCYEKNANFVPLENINGSWHCKTCADEHNQKNRIMFKNESKTANIIPFNVRSKTN